MVPNSGLFQSVSVDRERMPAESREKGKEVVRATLSRWPSIAVSVGSRAGRQPIDRHDSFACHCPGRGSEIEIEAD